MAEGREKNPRFFDEDLEDHQPFPTLQTVLQELEQHVGCNIEIKWTMQLKVKDKCILSLNRSNFAVK